MLILNLSRVDLIKRLPRSETVAEVGVFRGGFAAAILNYVRPQRLHLIDPWGKAADDEYVKTYRVTDDMELLYTSIKERYEEQIRQGAVQLHREYSGVVGPTFADLYFDWVYIDGMHSYDAVLSDLRTFAPKIKENGFLLGHDYSNTKMGRAKGFGVIGAVRRFCKEAGWVVLLITNEDAPSYVLARKEEASSAEALRSSLLNLVGVSAIDVDEEFMDHFEQVQMGYANGKRRTIFRFGEVPEDRLHKFL